MPKKSVREMSALERRHYSLAARTFHTVLIGALILGLVALAIGLGLYTYDLANRYTSEAFQISKTAAGVLQEAADIKPLSDDVMKAYRSLDEEIREGTRTEEYRARFASFTEREDYKLICRVLDDFSDAESLDAIYLAMYDEDTRAVVYIADPDKDPETVMMPCDWDPVSYGGMEKFLNWKEEDGKLSLIEKTQNYGWICTCGMPIRSDGNSITAFVLADITFSTLTAGMKNFLIQYTIAIVVVTLLMGYFFTRHMKKTLVHPINEIAEAAENYISDRRDGVKDTEHFALLNIHTGDEVENLSLLMADMEHDIADFEDNLTRIISDNERVNTELMLATKIQAAMMPHIFPPFPDRKEFDLYASMVPAREVGGDFYDFFLTDDDHLCMMVADVSGKGIPAALFMMASRIILANNAKMGKSPAQILYDTNASICANNREEMFVTVWLGILEISTGTLIAANAGHEYPAVMEPGGKFRLMRERHGLVIGGMEGASYKEYDMKLPPGSKLFVYTDGIPEAEDPEKNMFGIKRMLGALDREPDASPEQTLKNVRMSVDEFVRDAEQFDDLTMLCLEYKGTGGNSDV